MAHMERSRGTGEQQTDWIERAALTASFACLIHCIGLPVLFAALPALSRVLALPTTIHLWMVAIAVPASTIALLSGRSVHRATRPLLVGLAGLALLLTGASSFGETNLETPITVAGSLALAWAHLTNWRLRHRRNRPCDSPF